MGAKSLTVFVLCGALTVPLAGQGTGTESVVGRVLPSPGERALPSENTIIVRVQRPGTAQIQVVSVRDGGRFDVTGLSRGHYEVTVEAPGYRPGRTRFVLNPVGATNATMVYVTLGPREVDPDPPGGTVSVATLTVPDEALEQMNRAVEAHQQKDAEKAIEHLLKAIEIHPEYVEAYNQLTGQYLATQPPQMDKAVESAGKSVEIRPDDNPVPYRYLGLIHLQREEYAEAAQQLQKCIDQDPSHAATAFSLGRAYTALQRPDEAVTAFELAVEKEADNSTYHFGLGYSYFQLQRYEEAVRELKRVLELEPEGPRADMARQLLEQMP